MASPKVGIDTFLPQQFAVGAGFHDFSAVHHHHAVRVHRRGESVGNDDGRSSCHCLGNRGDHRSLHLRRQGRGGFVEHHDRWPQQLGASQRHDLSLSGRKVVRSFVQRRQEAPGDAGEDFLATNVLDRLFNLLAGGIRSPKGDVVRHRGGEEVGFLRHRSYFSTPLPNIRLFHRQDM